MKHCIPLLLFALTAITSIGQTAEQKKLDKWLAKHNIELNNPKAPEGFIQTTDCKSRPLYRQNKGDTIILYHGGSSIAQDLKTFKETLKDPNYGTLIYASKTQKNGTLIVHHFIKSRFIWRNDTLYIGDTYNEKASEETIKALDDFLNKRITSNEYGEIASSYKPSKERFKVIYYRGLFSSKTKYQFTQEENFRKESITLIDRWIDEEKLVLQVNLKTNTNGRYTFNSDMTLLETTHCNQKRN